MTATTDDHHARAPLRVLIATHGYEAPGWADETCRLVSTWAGPALRVLAVLDVPAPPFTSLTGAAQRAYAGARARWTEIERGRLEATITALGRGLPRQADVVSVPSIRGDIARTIAEEARTGPADLVVVGGPTPGWRSWLRTGPVHERGPEQRRIGDGLAQSLVQCLQPLGRQQGAIPQVAASFATT